MEKKKNAEVTVRKPLRRNRRKSRHRFGASERDDDEEEQEQEQDSVANGNIPGRAKNLHD
jgi:hypothetical protein